MINEQDYAVMQTSVRDFLSDHLDSFKADAKGYGLFNPCQCPEHDGDCEGMQLTIGTNGDGWGWQTGDNSFSGGAYSYPHWAVVHIFADTEAVELAKDALDQIDELLAQSGAFDDN
jgi:hypothetical protein